MAGSVSPAFSYYYCLGDVLLHGSILSISPPNTIVGCACLLPLRTASKHFFLINDIPWWRDSLYLHHETLVSLFFLTSYTYKLLPCNPALVRYRPASGLFMRRCIFIACACVAYVWDIMLGPRAFCLKGLLPTYTMSQLHVDAQHPAWRSCLRFGNAALA